MKSKLCDRLTAEQTEKTNLFNELCTDTLPLPVQKAIFEMAWEIGHSSGRSGVISFFKVLIDLQERIQAWYKAGNGGSAIH